jgi:hypothetical protein
VQKLIGLIENERTAQLVTNIYQII